MQSNLESLNVNQRAAVEWNEGPLLVLAGPGSGKTRVLTLRIAKLLTESPGDRFRILGLTFTNKAAAEMRSRVDGMVQTGRERALLTTFHSFAADVLRQHGSHIGIQPDFRILNQDADREALLEDVLQELSEERADVSTSDINVLSLLDSFLERCVPETGVVNYVGDTPFGAKLTAIYASYRKKLRVSNRLDFPSLLLCVYELFARVPAVAKQMRIIYRYICIDEFQDTNLAQYNMLRALLGDSSRNLFVVADDDQIIYQWNGASPERLAQVTNDYRMSVIQLPTNYRCPPSVIGLANKLIAHNSYRAADKLPLAAFKSSEITNSIRVRNFNSLDDEADWVAHDISQHPESARGAFVILARTKKVLERTSDALRKANIEVALPVRKNEFESTPLRWLHSMLRLANARGDLEQLRRVCKSFYELEGLSIDVKEITAFAPIYGGDFFRS